MRFEGVNLTTLLRNPDLPVYTRLTDIPSPERHIHKFKGHYMPGLATRLVQDKTNPKSLKFKVIKSREYRCVEEGCETKVYSCPTCKGYLLGEPIERGYNDMGNAPCAGRRGTELYCERCGTQLGELVKEVSVMHTQISEMKFVGGKLRIKF